LSSGYDPDVGLGYSDDAALAILVGAACSSEGLFLRLGSMRWLSPHVMAQKEKKRKRKGALSKLKGFAS
jgi:hypothetical protein